MKLSTTNLGLALLLAIVPALSAVASSDAPRTQPAVAFSDWQEPAWADTFDGFSISVRVKSSSSIKEVVSEVIVGDSDPITISGKVKADDSEVYTFDLRPLDEPSFGMLTFRAKVTMADGATHTSEERTLPLAYIEDLDITGNPPVVLPYPLFDKTHVVRYIPCCNIFGASIIAKRIPLNPMETDDGLPETLLSDFIVLEPDDLSASTAGTYMRMSYELKALKSGSRASLYHYDWASRSWSEVLSYEVNVDTGVIDFHCPDGGEFVLAADLAP